VKALESIDGYKIPFADGTTGVSAAKHLGSGLIFSPSSQAAAGKRSR
jgi:hypothetical protein